VDAILELLTENCINLRNGTPIVQNRDAWREFYKELYTPRINFISGSVTSSGIDISSSGDMAWDHGVFVSDLKALRAAPKQDENT
jgi:hypothetical protein